MARGKKTIRLSDPAEPFPFAAIVGMDEAKRALMLLAVDERLKGVLISSGPGTAKSTLVDSLASVWPSAASRSGVPFIKVPLNTTEDRLLGGIDFERTLSKGRPVFSEGLLACADGGVVLIEETNLLNAGIATLIADALDSEVLRIEREGMSASSPARFVIVGTHSPEEGELNAQLRDRAGMIVEGVGRCSLDDIEEISARAIDYENNPREFLDKFATRQTAIKKTIEEARARLGEVRLTREDYLNIARSAVALGIRGNRADIFAVRAARANAALEGRDHISDADLVTAIRLVLLPRVTTVPELESDSAPPDSIAEQREREQSHIQSETPRTSVDDLVIAAMDDAALDFLFSFSKQSGRGARPGKRAQQKDAASGRYWRSAARRVNSAKVAIDATLRAAAPFQRARRARINDRASVIINRDDLRFKRFKRRSGILFIFAVDASGSMRLNRMAQAKGALIKLLGQAYLNRDKVALIGFRRDAAEILLQPTRSVELARRSVEGLPSGGATPLAAGLYKALELARFSRLRERQQVALLIFTDARANVGLRVGNTGAQSEIRDEIREIGAALRRNGIKSFVVDTRLKFVSSGDGQALADLLGGRYVYLPRADSTAVYDAVKREASLMRLQSF